MYGATVPATSDDRFDDESVEIVNVDLDQTPEELSCCTRFGRWILRHKWRLLAVLFIVGVLLTAFLAFDLGSHIEDFLKFVDDHQVEGAFIFVAVYAVGTVFFVPGLVLTIGAGFVFPFWLAISTVLVGATLGMLFAFLAGRFVVHGLVQEYIQSKAPLKAIDTVMEEEGWRLCLMLRLAPIIPFTALNYVLAGFNISIVHYMWSSIVGIIPGSALFVYLGSIANSIGEIASGDASGGTTVTIVIICLSLVMGVAAVAYVTIKAKRVIARAVARGNINVNAGDDSAEYEGGPLDSQVHPVSASVSDSETEGKAFTGHMPIR